MADDPKINPKLTSWQPANYDVTATELSVIVMTVDNDGARWLDENCPEWKEHVALTEVRATDAIDHVSMVQMDKDASKKRMVSRLGSALGIEIIRLVIDATDD